MNFLLKLWRDESGNSAIRIGFGFAGAAVGFVFGGVQGAQLGYLAGSLIGGLVAPDELPDIEGNRLDPSQMMTSAYGDPIIVGIGRFVAGGTLAFYPGFDEHEIETETDGKGGPTQKTTSYTYTGNFRVNWCEGPADAILKIWANRKLIYDRTNTTNPIIDQERINNAPGANAIRIYLGTEDQLPDVKELELLGINETNAYRGIAGGFFQNYPLDDSGGVPPQMTALIATHATEVFPLTTLTLVSSGSFYEWQPGKASFIVDSSTRVSNITQTQIASGGAKPGLFPCVDSLGNFYGVEAGFGTGGGTFSKYDGETLQRVSNTAIFYPDSNCTSRVLGSLDWSHNRVFGGIRLLDGTLAGELIFAARDNSGSQMEVGIFDPKKVAGPCGGMVNSYFVDQLEISSSNVAILAVDSERHLWFISNETGETVLHRVQPGSGAVTEKHILTGEVYNHLCYDAHTNSLILGDANSHIARWSLDTNLETARLSGIAYVDSGSKNQSAWWNGPSYDGKLYLQTGSTDGTFQEFDIHDMVAGRTWSPSGDWGLSSSLVHVRGLYDESRHALIVRKDTGGLIYWLYLDRKVGDLITVKQVVDLFAGKVGLTSLDMDTSNLTDQLHGYLSARRQAANRALEPLRQLFFFNPISEDFIIKFPKMGGAVVATIPEDDLAAGDNDDPSVKVDKLAEEIIQEIELPEVLELGYANENAEYQRQVQRVKRPRSTTASKRRRSIAFPGTFLSNSDAKRRLMTLLYQIWMKRRPILFSTAQRWARLTPADVVNVVSDGVTQQVILGGVDYGANNKIEFAGAADDPSTLISTATGAEGIIPVQTIDLIHPPKFFIVDGPIFRTQDAGFGPYIAAAPIGNGTSRGQEIYRGLDGVNFGNYAFVAASRAVDHGFTTSIPGVQDADFWDRDTAITIQMLRGTLSSSTEALVIDGANPIIIGGEYMNFVTSVDNGNNNFTISTLLRGRKGTEGEITGHVANEDVIIPSVATFKKQGMDLADLNVAYFYKGVTRGGSFADGPRKLITVQGKSEWPWAPAHVSGSITSNDWTVGWTWRNFLIPQWKNLAGVPHPTGFDYEVDILNGPGGAVLATYTTIASLNGSVINPTAHTFFYDDADQTIDLGAPATTVTFKIYPMTANIGRGFPTEVTLTGA